MAWSAWAATYDAAAPVPPRLAGGGPHAYFLALPSKIRARRGPPPTIRVNALLPPTVVAAQTDACSAAEQQANDAQAACAVPEASEHGVSALLRCEGAVEGAGAGAGEGEDEGEGEGEDEGEGEGEGEGRAAKDGHGSRRPSSGPRGMDAT